MSKPKRKPYGFTLETEVVDYYRKLADESGLSFQGIINLALKECMKAGFKITVANVPKVAK
jgi:hypothetical protein